MSSFIRGTMALTAVTCGVFVSVLEAGESAGESASVRLTVTSELPMPRVPMDPSIDFGALIKAAGMAGVLNPNTIRVVNVATGQSVAHAVNEDFAYADSGRIEWVIQDPNHKEYDVRFSTAAVRPPQEPAACIPLIGVGDLLRYNAGEPRPIVMSYLSRLVDLTGDGKPDLVGCWNYAYRPGSPWDGVICYPRVGGDDEFLFGDLVRIRYVENAGSSDFKHLSHTYMFADFADFNGDGRPDLVYAPGGADKVYFYLNSGRRDSGGMPVFVASGSASRPSGSWSSGPCRAVDLNRDGAIDLVVGKTWLKNTNAKGWPFVAAPPTEIDAGLEPCFYDIDGDGALDAVCLVNSDDGDLMGTSLRWRRNLGGDVPKFGPPQPVPGIDAERPNYIGVVDSGTRRGLLVLHEVYQVVSFFEQTRDASGKPAFKRFGRAQSVSAVASLSDQAWPFACDWDGDGDWDLLIGGGYGWPRIVINRGSTQHPALTEPQAILSEGKPIRILRNDILGGKCWHNMGYPYPTFVDWDGDGLPDLVIPNETNRIFWYKNIGMRQEPRFSPQLQVICDGYPDSPEKRAQSARLANNDKTPNAPYPHEKDEPFFWRTGAAFGDYNGDGLIDLVTLDCLTSKCWLFARYRDGQGQLRLRKDRPMKLADGRVIDDSIVARSAHWTESFKCVDWDGDGLPDLVYSCAGTETSKGSIYLLRNVGTRTDPVFANPVTLCCFGVPIKVTAHGPHPYVGDLDGDGKPDLLTCVEWSVYPFYSYPAMQMKQRPTFTLGSVKR